MLKKLFSVRTVLICLLTVSIIKPVVQAATPQTVATTDFGPLDGFDLYGKGLVWWNAGSRPGPVTPARTGQIVNRVALSGAFLDRRNSGDHIAISSLDIATYAGVENQVVRSGDKVFFYADRSGRRIFRRSVYGPEPSDLGNDFSGVNYDSVGAMTVIGSSLWWSVIQNGESQIRQKSVDAGAGGGDTIVMQNIGLAKKLKVVRMINTSGAFTGTRLLILNVGGQLYSYDVNAIFNPSPQLIASNVSDFDTREESRQDLSGPFPRTVHGLKVYVATGVDLGSSRPAGRLRAINLTEGGSMTEYPGNDVNVQITSVVVDADNLYITRTPVITGVFARLDLPNSVIMRKISPAHSGIIVGGEFETIATGQEGRNLRADGQWIYWAHGSSIRKLKTDAAAIQLDFRAIGLEAIQAVQDFNNSLPLVAGKPAFVKFYVQLVTNTTPKTSFPLTAELRGFLNDVELFPTPAEALNNPIVDTTESLSVLRANTNRSFHFEIPAEWLAQAGQLRLECRFNPGGLLETGENAFANNTIVRAVQVVPGRVPILMFKEMSSTLGNYNPLGENFSEIIERATSMLPISRLRYHISPGSVTRPQWTIFGVQSRSFELPDQDSLALAELEDVRQDSDDPGPDTHWVGTFPAGVDNWNGLGYTGKNSLIIRMNTAGFRGAVPWGSIIGGHTLAHELSHNYGRLHINQASSLGCSTNIPLGPYHYMPNPPGDPCFLGFTNLANPAAPIGFDQLSGTIVLPHTSADMLTYNSNRWISPFNWNELIAAIPVTPGFTATPDIRSAQAQGAAFRISGIIYPESGSGLLSPSFQMPSGILNAAKVQRSLEALNSLPQNAPYRLRFIGNPQIAPLTEVPVQISQAYEEGRKSLHFSQSVPFMEGVTRVQLLQGNKMLDEIIVSPSTPVLALGVPSVDLQEQSITLEWNATDADGDALFFTTQFSHDGGAKWQTLQLRDPRQGISVGLKFLPGGNQCRIRVIATDRLNTAIATTAAFQLPKGAPMISIDGVADQQKFNFGDKIFARITAYDAEDGGLDPDSIEWTLTGPDPRAGTGENLSAAGLASGVYSLKVIATDKDNSITEKSLSFSVRPTVVHEAPAAPEVDGLSNDGAYDSAVVITMRRNGGNIPPSKVRMVRHEGNLYVSFTELSYSTPPATAVIYFDTDGNPTPIPQASDVGFGITQDGVPMQFAGNGTLLAKQTNMAEGFNAEVVLGDNSWSAELSIPESLLGGWEHAAGMMLTHSLGNETNLTVRWPPNALADKPDTYVSASFGPLTPVPNRSPVAIASGPSVISVGEAKTVSLDGSHSYDLDGNPLAFTWSQIAGPEVVLNGATTATPSFTIQSPSQTTRARFRLVVNDGHTNSVPAEVSIQLVPEPASVTVSQNYAIGTSNGVTRGTLRWAGSVGSRAVVQVSTNLLIWEDIATNTVGFLQTIAFSDAAARLAPYRFYRAKELVQTRESVAGKALRFDGVDDFVQVPHNAALNLFPLTVTAWIKTDRVAPAHGIIASKYLPGSANGYSMHIFNGRLNAWYFRDSQNRLYVDDPGVDGGFVANGDWQHVAFVVDNDGLRTYVNGSRSGSLQWLGTPGAPTSTQPLRFGRQVAYPYIGELDEVTIWNRALREDEIQSLINQPLQGTETGLSGYWIFDEGTETVVSDVSGHGHTGTLQNGPAWVDSTAPIFQPIP